MVARVELALGYDPEPVRPVLLTKSRQFALRLEEDGGLVHPLRNWRSDNTLIYGSNIIYGSDKAIRFPNSEKACQFVERHSESLTLADPAYETPSPPRIRQWVSLEEGNTTLVTQRFLPGCYRKGSLQATRTEPFIFRKIGGIFETAGEVIRLMPDPEGENRDLVKVMEEFMGDLRERTARF